MGQYYIIHSDDELYHHGIKGMHWGVRRYQNEDGSLTEAGRSRMARYTKKIDRQRSKLNKNNATIAKVRGKKLDTTRAMKLKAKRAKYQSKRDRLEVKNARTRIRASRGKSISERQNRNLQREYKLDKKIARINKKLNPAEAKVARIQAKNAKIINKISNIERRSDRFKRRLERGKAYIDRKEQKLQYKKKVHEDNIIRIKKEYPDWKDGPIIKRNGSYYNPKRDIEIHQKYANKYANKLKKHQKRK